MFNKVWIRNLNSIVFFGETLLLRTLVWLICALALLSGLRVYAATVRTGVTLLTQPTQRSVAVATLAEGAQIEIMSRNGLWSEVCCADACGWLRITAISRDSGTATTKTSLAALQTGRDGAGNAVSSTGVRGLDAEAIKVDQPDYEALVALRQWQVTPGQAIRFAEEGFLEDRSLAALAQPVDESSSPHQESRMFPDPDRISTSRPTKKKRVEASDDDW